MKRVRMPGFLLVVLGSGGIFFAATAILCGVCGGDLEAAAMLGVMASGCLVMLLFALSCHLNYDDTYVRRWSPLGWRTVRLSEIDSAKTTNSAVIYYAGSRRIRLDHWARDEGDFSGAVHASCKAQGIMLKAVDARRGGFCDRLFRHKLKCPEEFVLVGVMLLAAGPVMAFGTIVSRGFTWETIAFSGICAAVFGILELSFILIIRHAERFPRLARLLVKPGYLRLDPKGGIRRKG